MITEWVEADSSRFGADRWVDFSNSNAFLILPSYPQLTNDVAAVVAIGDIRQEDASRFLNSIMVRKMEQRFDNDPYTVDYCSCDSDHMKNESNGSGMHNAGKITPRLRTRDLMEMDSDFYGIEDELASNIGRLDVRGTVVCPQCGLSSRLAPYMLTFLDIRRSVNNKSVFSLSAFAARSNSMKRAMKILCDAGISPEVVSHALYELGEKSDCAQYVSRSTVRAYKKLLESRDEGTALLMAMMPLVFNNKPYGRDTERVLIEAVRGKSVPDILDAVERGVPSLEAYSALLDNDVDGSMIDSLIQGVY